MKLSRITNLSIIFISLYLLVLALREFSAVLRPLAIAFILSFLFVPSFDPKIKKKKWVWVVPIIVILVSLLFILSIWNPLREEVADLDNEYESMDLINATANASVVSSESSDFEFNLPFLTKSQWQNYYFQGIDYSFKFLSDFVSELIVLVLFLIFLLSAYAKSLNSLIRSNKKYLEFFIEVEKNVKSYMTAKSILSFITALISFFVMWIFDVNFKFLLAFVIFLFNFVPTFGSIVAVLIVVLVDYLKVGFGFHLIGVASALIVVQLIIGNYVDPKYVGKKLSMSPLLVLISLIFWGVVWGIPGMFFSVPLTSMIIISFKHFSSIKGGING